MRPPQAPDDSRDPEPEASVEPLTPRGGFMARPGLKRPPQHAVVVRVGDAPPSEHIPLARSSAPPPPPPPLPRDSDGAGGAPLLPPDARLPSEATATEGPDTSSPVVTDLAPDSESQKITLRALSTPPPPLSATMLGSAPVESMPPASDMPVVASVPPQAPGRQRAQRSRWAIALAAAAGLVLGLASVATTAHRRPSMETSPAAAASPAFEAAPLPAATPSIASTPAVPPSAASAEPTPQLKPALPAAPAGSARRTIF